MSIFPYIKFYAHTSMYILYTYILVVCCTWRWCSWGWLLYTGWGQSRLQFWVCETEFILILLFTNFCIISHTNICKTTFALPCFFPTHTFFHIILSQTLLFKNSVINLWLTYQKLHTFNMYNSMCLAYMYTCETVTFIKIMNTAFTPNVPACLCHPIPRPLSRLPSDQFPVGLHSFFCTF